GFLSTARFVRSMTAALAALRRNFLYMGQATMAHNMATIATQAQTLFAGPLISFLQARQAANAAPGPVGRARQSPRVLGFLNSRQGFTELRLVLIAEVGLDEGPAKLLELLHDLVRSHLPDQHAQGRGTGLECCAQFLHEIVVDADVLQGPGHRAGSGADG